MSIFGFNRTVVKEPNGPDCPRPNRFPGRFLIALMGVCHQSRSCPRRIPWRLLSRVIGLLTATFTLAKVVVDLWDRMV